MGNASSIDNKNAGGSVEREDVFKDEIKMKIPDMNCNHCKQRITGALSEMDVVTAFEVDLENREVTVELKDLTAKKQVIEAIEEMGYTPTLI